MSIFTGLYGYEIIMLALGIVLFLVLIFQNEPEVRCLGPKGPDREGP